jgi:hypothetical protein
MTSLSDMRYSKTDFKIISVITSLSMSFLTVITSQMMMFLPGMLSVLANVASYGVDTSYKDTTNHDVFSDDNVQF